MPAISWEDFERVELRVGTIIEVSDFPEAEKPSYKLKIDFGEHGIKRSSAQIRHLYAKEGLVNMQVVCVMNFRPKQVANFMSEVLVTGVVKDGKCVALLQPDRKVPNGLKVA